MIRATFSSAIKLLREREDYMFFASSASFYRLVEETDPELFVEVRALVKEGRWRVVGGWWVEPDCNLPSGEAMVRHSLYAQTYFKRRFGLKASTCFNIDSFGHAASIPQILVKSGIGYAVLLRPGPHEMGLLGRTFRWRSPDGSEVIAHRIMGAYNASGERIRQLVGKAIDELEPPLSSSLVFVGRGDHGGGPEIDDLEIIDRVREEVKPVDLKFAPTEEFFGRAERLKESLPLVEGELQHHASGCYAAVSRVKELNRRTEEALVAAEKYNFMANVLAGTRYFSGELYRAWTNLLFCQFHDVLAGSCIKEAYEGDVFPMMEEALSLATEVANTSTQAVASRIKIDRGRSIIVFNPHACPLKAPIQINWIGEEVPPAIKDEHGKVIPCQVERGSALTGNASSLIFVAKLPALGYRTYDASQTEPLEGLLEKPASGEPVLENDSLRVEINEADGTLGRIILKEANKQVISGGAKPVVINDESDTWSHGVFRYDDEAGQFSCDSVEVIEKGAVRSVVRAKYRYGSSSLRQDFVLYSELDYLVCEVKVDWHERMKLLKLAFPIDVQDPEATYEIQYGTIKRPTGGEEEPGLRWVDITGESDLGQALGATLINDSKYSYDARGTSLRLTALRSPIYAHHFPTPVDREREPEYTDQGIQEFTYVVRPHAGPLNPREPIQIADIITAPPMTIVEHEHGGALPSSLSLVNVAAENVVLKVVKKAEESDDWVLRLYETSGETVTCRVSLPIHKTSLEIELKPHEIKTLLLKEQGRKATEVSMIEEE